MKRKSSGAESHPQKRRQRSRQQCGHCQQFLSNSQYHEHRRLFFDATINEWRTVDFLKRVKNFKGMPEDVLGSSSSESEGIITCFMIMNDVFEL